jgi:hypothetical protein
LRNKLITKFSSPLALSILLLGFMTAPMQSVHAAVSRVEVTLPNFPVVLDSHRVDVTDRQYPLIVYKEITYVPMTWFDCRMLGLVTSWSEDRGLAIEQAPVTSSYAPYAGHQKNASRLYAKVADGPITVNGNHVDNTKEQYPLLSFRDVIYFPLTWRFAHDEFGWSYSWDDKQGLAIASNNPRVEDVDLPTDATDEDVALFQNYYYFVERTDPNYATIYRVPASDTSKRESVRSIDANSEMSMSSISFYIANDRLRARYHVGGATLGHYEDIQIEPADTSGNQAVAAQTGQDTVMVGTMPPPSRGNLYLVRANQPDAVSLPIGDPGLIYGWHLEFQPNGGSGGGVVDAGTLIGHQVYVMASPSNGENPNRIYSVNIDTNETVKIVDTSVSNYKIIANKLYYIKDSDHQLYSAGLTERMKRSYHQVVQYPGTMLSRATFFIPFQKPMGSIPCTK